MSRHASAGNTKGWPAYFSADAIKSGHDISEFLGCLDFCSSYYPGS